MKLSDSKPALSVHFRTIKDGVQVVAWMTLTAPPVAWTITTAHLGQDLVTGTKAINSQLNSLGVIQPMSNFFASNSTVSNNLNNINRIGSNPSSSINKDGNSLNSNGVGSSSSRGSSHRSFTGLPIGISQYPLDRRFSRLLPSPSRSL